MEFDNSIILAVFLGMLLLLVILFLGVMIAGALAPRPSRGAPLIASEDGHFEVAGKRISCSHCGGSEFSVNQILLNTWLLSLFSDRLVGRKRQCFDMCKMRATYVVQSRLGQS